MFRLRSFAPLLVVAALASGLFVTAHSVSGDSKADSEEGFRPLFNGKDLTGWHKNPEKIGHGTGASWVVVDGAIVGEQNPPGSGNGGILLTDEKFGDFEVRFEVNPDWGPDSGFFVRSNDKGQCFQMMIDYHDAGNVGEIYREGLDGATNRTFDLNAEYADDKKTVKRIVATKSANATSDPKFNVADWNRFWKHGDWNAVAVRVKGNPPTIDTWINGQHITTYTSDKAFEKELGDKGSIAVQVHGGVGAWPKGSKVRFRNLRVKPL
jgi:hypothetical protein